MHNQTFIALHERKQTMHAYTLYPYFCIFTHLSHSSLLFLTHRSRHGKLAARLADNLVRLADIVRIALFDLYGGFWTPTDEEYTELMMSELLRLHVYSWAGQPEDIFTALTPFSLFVWRLKKEEIQIYISMNIYICIYIYICMYVCMMGALAYGLQQCYIVRLTFPHRFHSHNSLSHSHDM